MSSSTPSSAPSPHPPPPPPPPPHGGLSHSDPIKTVASQSYHGVGLNKNMTSGIAPSSQSSTTPAPSSITKPYSQQSQPPPPPPPNARRHGVQTPSPSAASNQSSLSSPQQSVKPSTSRDSPMDREADMFLSVPGRRSVPILNPLPLPENESEIERVRTLVSRRAWGDVLLFSGEILNNATSPHQPFHAQMIQNTYKPPVSEDPLIYRLQQETAEILSYRFSAMLKLRRYSELGKELEKLNLTQTLESEKEGMSHWIPCGLKILAAQSIQYTDKPQRCIDTLYKMKHHLTDSEKPLWLNRLNSALANAFIRQKEWRMALSTLDDIYENLEIGVKHEISRINTDSTIDHDVSANDSYPEILFKAILSASRIEVLSRQGRIFLQIGALDESSLIFDEAKEEMPNISKAIAYYASPEAQSDTNNSIFAKYIRENTLINYSQTQLLINEGLIHFANDEFDQSINTFNAAIDVYRSSVCKLPSTHPHFLTPGIGIDLPEYVISTCLNNMALCALYTCQMHYAVNLMESLIREDPTTFLTEALAFNLCTLYELGSDHNVSNRKKMMLQTIAKRFFLHDVTSESFRIN